MEGYQGRASRNERRQADERNRHGVHQGHHGGVQAKKLLVLAAFLKRFPDELRADFQQYYGLNLDDMGGAYSISHAACLAAQLPKDSRTFVAADPMCEYASTTNRLLALIEFHAHTGWWIHTEAARKGRNEPQPVFGSSGKANKTQGESLTIEQYEEILARPRREVQHG